MYTEFKKIRYALEFITNICLYFNIYFEPYILELVILHLCIASKSFVMHSF